MLAGRALREIGPARLVREKKANIVRAIDRVAKLLGNTRAVCRKYYVHPVILEAYSRGKVLPPAESRERDRRKPERRLRHDEIAVLRFIEENQR